MGKLIYIYKFKQSNWKQTNPNDFHSIDNIYFKTIQNYHIRHNIYPITHPSILCIIIIIIVENIYLPRIIFLRMFVHRWWACVNIVLGSKRPQFNTIAWTNIWIDRFIPWSVYFDQVKCFWNIYIYICSFLCLEWSRFVIELTYYVMSVWIICG